MKNDDSIIPGKALEIPIQKRLQAALDTCYKFQAWKTHDDVAKGFEGLFLLALYQQVSAKEAEVLRKILSDFAHHKFKFLEVDFPDEILKAFESRFTAYDEALQQLLTPEQWVQFRAITGGHADAIPE